ncbi:MAG: Exodeoxyribonuclease 7 large subunit [Ignavibacteria bacterium]|nr:Exodeoxyribonuclease 7 large subunit [Ignavibacteria bacterium]
MDSIKTVSELTREIKELVEYNFGFVLVEGEISNFKLHTASGHLYFTLKDEKAQINAVMWNSRTFNLEFKPDNGMKVQLKGRITLFESRGSYQIDVFEMKQAGKGDLYAEFEKLKLKLQKEGLFDAVHKKRIPDFPERVAVITSESGAALQDFIKVTRKRYPFVKLYLLNAIMQGDGSADSVCRAIKHINKSRLGIDVMVITRGGGSIEDLWSFNNENVVREIFNSHIPVVTAIGHETDFTLSDFAADIRAATPSAAAENIFKDKNEMLRVLDHANEELKDIVKSKIENLKNQLDNISRNYYFRKPQDMLNEFKLKTDEMYKKISDVVRFKLNSLNQILNTTEKLLVNLSPDQILKRGYTIVFREDKVLSRKKYLKKDDELKIKFYDGETGVKVSSL